MKQSKIRKRPDSNLGNIPNEKSVKKEKKCKKRKEKKLKGIHKGKTNDSNCRGSKTIVQRSRNGEDVIHMEEEKAKNVNTKYSEGNDINDVALGGNFENNTEEETPREKEKKKKVKREKEKKNKVKRDKEEKKKVKRDKEEKKKVKRDKEEKKKVQRDKEEKKKVQRDKEEKKKVQRDKEEKKKVQRDKEEKKKVKRDKEEKKKVKRDKGGIIHSIVDFLSKYEKESKPVGGKEKAKGDAAQEKIAETEEEKAAETEEKKEKKSKMIGEKRDKVLMHNEEDIKERKERTVFVGNVPIKNMNPTMLLKILNVQKSMVDSVIRSTPLYACGMRTYIIDVVYEHIHLRPRSAGLVPVHTSGGRLYTQKEAGRYAKEVYSKRRKNGRWPLKHGEEDNFYRKKTVCIKNLDKSLNEKDLYFLFKEVDEIKGNQNVQLLPCVACSFYFPSYTLSFFSLFPSGIRMLRDIRTYVSKNRASVRKAIDMFNGKTINDRKIIVEKVEDEKEAEKKGRREKYAFVKRSEERKSMNRNGDRKGDRNGDRNGDRYGDRKGDRNVKRKGDRSVNRKGDRSVNRKGDRNGGRIFDKPNMKKKKYIRTKR
ncbi:large subunit rRNA processing RRM protein, putative [Plasmodium ovale wallikeri]|uniref:Large subunit rRNA processing RRM protein, putative n=1 Tax=Plasmodium ovale wallikeri TaxID=864142 RepID=A0A1A8YMA3_PLAOA|nr:large subunit rRNA processing RRM protein, putative [Plasmodium ovale wallikeri]